MFHNYREYISAPLLVSMQSGVNYYVSMYVNFSCNTNPCYDGNDGLGIYISNGTPDTTGIGTGVLPNNPQINLRNAS